MPDHFDVAVIGAGAAGLMAAIFASRGGARVVALDGAKKLGAKILISGGGRCNVTHDVVHAADFNGSRNAIAKVLRTFSVEETIAFFRELGVEMKREETGKLFPVTDRAATVLDALLRAAPEVRSGYRVNSIRRILPSEVEPRTSNLKPPALPRELEVRGSRPELRGDEVFVINDELLARRVILATGGRSVPKTGSDGSGYALARGLGHSVTDVFPALVPLLLPAGHPLTLMSGVSVDAELSVRSTSGRVLHRERGSMLFTHFGLSGPVVLDVSRHWIASQPATLTANLLPGATFESVDALLIDSARSVRNRLPARLWDLLAADVPVRPSREQRRALARSLVELELPVTGDRGFQYAEVTAGGVPLSEVDVSTMESRVCPGLYLCGEILDVDGKIGGYNFQWAWATGRLAGMSAGRGAGTRR
jgi:predicted flavoprotein YhiN